MQYYLHSLHCLTHCPTLSHLSLSSQQAQAAQVAAYPPASAPYPPQAQSNTGHSTSDPYQPQANPPLPQGTAQNPDPVPDDVAESAGFLLQP